MPEASPELNPLFFASVATDPARQLPGAGEIAVANPLRRLEEALDKARSRDPAAVAVVCAALSDHHLEHGRLDRARAYLLEGLIAAESREPAGTVRESAGPSRALRALSLERRDAWLDYLRGEPRATDRLATLLTQADQQGQVLESVILTLYLTLIRVRRGAKKSAATHVLDALNRLRSHSDMLPRVALFASIVLAEAGETDRARVEALRVRILADNQNDTVLAGVAGTVLDRMAEEHGTNERIQQLVSVAIEVSRRRALPDVLQAIVDSTLTLLDADRAFVIRTGPRGPSVVARAGRDPDPGAPSMSIARRALELGREVVAADLGDEAAFNAANSVVALGLRTALCVPMSDGPTILGALYADSRRASHEELFEAAWLVRAFASHAAAAVRNAEQNEAAERAVLLGRELNHDVRNLVSTLQMGLETLSEDGGLEPWATDLVGKLMRVSGLIQRQVAGALSGAQEEPRPVELNKLVHRVCEFSRFDGRKKGVDIRVTDTAVVVLGREDAFTRIVSNLVGNALKYSPAGATIDVVVGTRAVGGEEHAVLVVRDHGAGIPEDALEAIFDSGVQATGHHEGYGLGLGICRRLVEEAGGTIRASNAPDGGARFEVQLPTRNPAR
ncbi:MAG: ATP-binding protein [Myxococcota bacterium]